MPAAPRLTRGDGFDRPLVLIVAAAAGLAAAVAGAQPTGSPVADFWLVALAAAAVTWAAASAPWWAAAGAAGIGAITALQPVVSIAGAVGCVGGVVVGLRRDEPGLRAVVGGIAVNVLIRSELGGFFGSSSLVGIVTCAMLFLLGVAGMPAPVRRAVAFAASTVGVLAVLAALALAVVAVGARSEVTEAADRSEQAIDALNDGQYTEAADLFDEASAGFAAAGERVGGPLAAPAAVIPGLAQNVRAAHDLSEAASSAASEAAGALRDADLANVSVVDGAIDIAAVRALEAPLLRLQVVLDDLAAVTADTDSPWLVRPLRDELADLGGDLAENDRRLDDVVEAVRVAPALLGGDGQRRYLLLFTTPAGARGLGGVVENYAELTVVDGRFTITAFDRRDALADGLAERPAFCTGCPDEILERYGTFGFDTGPNGSVAPTAWSNVTMPAHFPHVAETVAVLYPQSRGAAIDGVVVMDPYAVEALMGFTGSVELPGPALTIEPDQAAEFILEEQYEVGADDALQILGEAVIAGLLTSTLPDLPDLGRELAPLVDERRVMMWSIEEDERVFLDRVGALGALPELGPDGGFSVSVSNLGTGTIDTFLERTTDVVVEVAADGTRRLEATVALTNGAPPAVFPDASGDDASGDDVGLPPGTSRLYVTMYGPPGLEASSRDGVPVELEASTEAGWSAYGDLVELAPGQRVEYVMVFELAPTFVAPGEPVRFEQPLARR